MSVTVVIGAGSTASFGGANCILSANWGFNPGRTDAYCLGEFNPSEDYVIYKPTQTLSLTLYAPGPTYSTVASTDCEIANTVPASVSASACGGTNIDISGEWHVTSYSYSKEDKSQPAQESWSFTKWIGAKDFLTGNAAARAIEPTQIIRTAAQGQSTSPHNDTGINFSSTFAVSQTGSVSANSVGKSSELTHGIVQAVGGGSNAVGTLGNGSASVPYTPLYI